MLSSWKDCLQQRWIFAIMGCLGLANAFSMMMCLSLAITEMVKTRVTTSNNSVLEGTCQSIQLTSPSHSRNSGGSYEWDEFTQGIILSSFHWGYLLTHVPGGLLSEKFGGKSVLGLSILFASIFCLLTPLVVHVYDSTGFVVLRVLMGLCEGTVYPTLSVLISKWAPPNERSKISTLVTSGAALGSLLGNAMTGVLIQYSPIGWSIVFYAFGTGGLLWFIACNVLCYDNPDVHPFISVKERKYLNDSIRSLTLQTRQTPWRHLLTSVPVWALIVGQSGYLWSFYTLASDLPQYMKSVMNFSIKSSGFVTAVPYILKLVFSNLMSWPADWLIESKRMSRTNVRKVWFTFAMIVPTAFTVAACYSECNSSIVVILFTIAVTSMGPNYSSIMVNSNDLSQNFAGTIAAIAGTVSSLSGVLAPYVIGILTPNQTLSEWRIVFWISLIVSWSTILIFDMWADGEVQYWNNLEVKVDREEGIGNRVGATVYVVHSVEPSS